ncbi:Phosphoglycerate mutase, PhoE family [Candidatus Methylacidithermus pantelleriae]|uniref:Phosphoglycerate mutase, PhoE family n=1 Tax=Candidatus Methylacidithermus pantelleriae TaxID=2744239 RepID=A0A8J2BM72_9BACT|nr:Phosphoglycerate mutase, PhoE family [Candidatus Methylacidithermus pantelleriae]
MGKVQLSRNGPVEAPLYIVRHCKTRWNLEGRIQGLTDVPLCEEGRQEARENLAKLRSLGLRWVACSPLSRGKETAELYAKGLGIGLVVCDDLREIDLGEWEGKRSQDLLEDSASPYARWLEDPSQFPLPPGSTEPVWQAQERIVRAVAKLWEQGPQGPFLIVLHKYVRALLHCALLGLPLRSFSSWIIETTEPYAVSQEELDRLCQAR